MPDTAPKEQQTGSSASALAAARPSLEQREFAVKVMRAYLRDMADDGNLTDAQSVTLMQAVGMFDQLLPLLAEQEAARRDSKRLDWIFSELSLTEIDAKMQRVRDAYYRLWMDAHPEDFQARAIRDAIDAARQSTPTGATNE